jgi:hypothetical protein
LALGTAFRIDSDQAFSGATQTKPGDLHRNRRKARPSDPNLNIPAGRARPSRRRIRRLTMPDVFAAFVF